MKLYADTTTKVYLDNKLAGEVPKSGYQVEREWADSVLKAVLDIDPNLVVDPHVRAILFAVRALILRDMPDEALP